MPTSTRANTPGSGITTFRPSSAGPLKIVGSDELTTINGLVDMVGEIAGIEVNRDHNLSAPKGVNGRNSDNTMIKRILGWEPSIPLRDGLAKTYAWIEQQYADRKAGRRTVQD